MRIERHGWPVRAFLQELGNGRMRPEEEMLRQALLARNVPVTLYTTKRLQRSQLPLGPDCFLAGDGDCVIAALRQLGCKSPLPLDYPEALCHFLRRPVWQSTLGKFIQDLECSKPLFVKPAARAKRFSGRLFEGPADLYFLYGTSLREPVWCSTPVNWVSEWRAYVLGDRVLALCHYSGADNTKPDPKTIEAMIVAYRTSGTAPAGFAMDVGVLDDGHTALVEINDALALGAYGVAAEDYTALLLARWRELVQPR